MLSTRRYSTWDQFLGFNRYFKFLIDVSGYFRSLINVGGYSRSLIDASGYLVSVEFGGIIRSIKSSKFLRYGVDISRNLKLSKFFKFKFKVKVVHYRVFLLTTGGSK